jgi:hypothetical protein
MWRLSTYLLLGGIFAAASALLYFIHYLIFQDVHHIFIYMVGDLAFLPLEVFLVVLVIERVLNRREKQAVHEKLNMVTGAFLSEVGNNLLLDLLNCFPKKDELRRQLAIKPDWTHADFRRAMDFAGSLELDPDCADIDLEELKALLVEKRQFLVNLLESPNVLEHDRFTDLLWATFHLTEELEARESLVNLPSEDMKHISGDIRRLYKHLLVEWVMHVEHLQSSYPHLFSLVARTHPFQESPSATVTG